MIVWVCVCVCHPGTVFGPSVSSCVGSQAIVFKTMRQRHMQLNKKEDFCEVLKWQMRAEWRFGCMRGAMCGNVFENRFFFVAIFRL